MSIPGNIVEAAERILLGKIHGFDSKTTYPSGVPGAGSDDIENALVMLTGPIVVGAETEKRVRRFHRVEVVVDFHGFNNGKSLGVSLFKSRLNPAGVAAGGNPGAYNSAADDADTWCGLKAQTAYDTPVGNNAGNVLIFPNVGGSRWLHFLASGTVSGGADLWVYGISDRGGGI